LRCVAGRAHVVVRVTNEDAVPASLEIDTPFGVRSVEQLDAGRAVSVAVATRRAEVAAGTVAVTATAERDGTVVTGRTSAPYRAATCR
ncbi:MAG TPA: hypothetical protein VK039_03635, partial [Brevibacterium sp.]|nr:hypothetical protein [Brevibacterium sp.]